MHHIVLTRRGFIAAGIAAVGAGRLPWRLDARGAPLLRRPVPSPAQLVWQRDELALFIHFGVNTFTDREWGDGREDPGLFAPSRMDARQWARAARAAGFRAMILTAKHHDGFCLWQTRTTQHSVARSPWRGGNGDVVWEFTQACHAEGLRAGLYCSPWDQNAPSYGDSPRYDDFYCDQLTELLTRYGPIHEVWFDGANGEGPDGRRQVYDWQRYWSLVRRLQPDAVIFSDAGPDVRWIGNERGVAGETNWSTVDLDAVPFPGATGDHVIRALQEGDPAGTVWRPGETDVSIRPGWFYHPAEDDRVKTVDDLVEIFFTSVGRNSKLLLNVPPTRDGVLHPTDVERLAGLHARLGSTFATDLAANRLTDWRVTGERTAIAELDLIRTVSVGIADLREDIEHGQAVARYVLEGFDGSVWRPLAGGTTIGYRKLDRFAPASVRRVRVVVEDAVDTPGPVRIGLYANP
ncbi:MAG TPA: alpha-L-fucosidase [Gemmatimonadaceae bacterium]|nr:alpha-L-fucosidase [Gemmatimonadaceae bacterium]